MGLLGNFKAEEEELRRAAAQAAVLQAAFLGV